MSLARFLRGSSVPTASRKVPFELCLAEQLGSLASSSGGVQVVGAVFDHGDPIIAHAKPGTNERDSDVVGRDDEMLGVFRCTLKGRFVPAHTVGRKEMRERPSMRGRGSSRRDEISSTGIREPSNGRDPLRFPLDRGQDPKGAKRTAQQSARSELPARNAQADLVASVGRLAKSDRSGRSSPWKVR